MSSIILEARDVRYRYPRGLEAIRGISFHIRRKEKIALVGPNGAGKSTLLKMFNGMIRPDSGLMLFDNLPIKYDSESLRMLRKRVGFVLQNPDRQIIAPTVYQDVAFGPTNLGYTENEVKRVVTLALLHVGLEGFERRPPHQLSGGEKKRVAIAGVLAMDPDVLVLDEPTSGLDPSGSEDIMELLDELNHEGKTIIISTHDVELAYPWADRAILILGGKILQEDIPEIAFGNPEYIRRAHLSLPILLELHLELQKRGFLPEGKKPRTVLDMMQCFETIIKKTSFHAHPGTITICNVDRDNPELLRSFRSTHPSLSTGAMGTRAKQRAENEQINLDFTYGVIDKCILKALLGDDSLILTTESMINRVYQRVDAYGRESGISIQVKQLDGGSRPFTENIGSVK
jgi:cobalt/nickel transport system ATP-binding protein